MELHEIANKVDSFVLDATLRMRFTNHINNFCKMVEDCGQALQPYATKLEKFHKAIDEGEFVIPETMMHKRPDGLMESSPVVELCPPPKDWVKMGWENNRFVNVDIGVIYRPVEPVNPLLWFGLFGWAGIQRKPEEDEKLMCEYVRLAIVHDYDLLFHSGTPLDTRIISADYKGKWFQRDKFFKTVWYYHSQLTESAQSQLTRAFDLVKADLKPLEPQDLITLSVAIRNFNVSKSTLRRAIKDGRLQGYKQGKKNNSQVKVSASEVKGCWPKK